MVLQFHAYFLFTSDKFLGFGHSVHDSVHWNFFFRFDSQTNSKLVVHVFGPYKFGLRSLIEFAQPFTFS